MVAGRLIDKLQLLSLLALFAAACSSQQADDQGLETTQQQEEQNFQQDDNFDQDDDQGFDQDQQEDDGDVLEEEEVAETIEEDEGEAEAELATLPNPDELTEELAEPEAVPMTPAPAGDGVLTGLATAAAGPGLPELGSKLSYIVRKGDTLGNISRMIYGTPKRWQELADLSLIENPHRIYPGDIVYYQLDQEALAFATEYENAPIEVVEVREGDTLGVIAKRVYGDASQWRHIWRLNGQISDPDKLAPGARVQFVPLEVLTAMLPSHKGPTLASLKASTALLGLAPLRATLKGSTGHGLDRS